MRILPYRILQICFTVMLCLHISSSATAQGNSVVLPAIQFLLDDWKEVQYFYPGEPIITVYTSETRVKKAQRISKAYNGFAVELIKTEMPMLSTDGVFKKFGNIWYDRNEDGTYSYFIITEFTTKKSIKQFIASVLKTTFPNAKIVKYKQGLRK